MTGQARERVNQKRRTRRALAEAAQRLLEEGRVPTVAEVADEALVSRATAYRYFPSQEHLLLDVLLSRSIEDIDRAVEQASGQGDATTRVAGLVSSVHDEISAHEARFRSLLRLSVAQPVSEGATIAAIRGGRRLRWIEHALAPLADRVDSETHRRLTNALALCVGTEALVVLRDLCGLAPDETRDTLVWAARALVAHALEAPP